MRTDHRVPLTLDSNVWNFIFDRQIDLCRELPCVEFAFYITREVEIEGGAIIKPELAALRSFIQQTRDRCDVTTTSVFGFSGTDDDPQVYGGFNVGTWQSAEERAFYEIIRPRYLEGKAVINLTAFNKSGVTLKRYILDLIPDNAWCGAITPLMPGRPQPAGHVGQGDARMQSPRTST